MLTRIKNFFKPMWRTIWIALAGQGVFLVSVFTMSPLRMWENPVANYNLFYIPLLAVILGWLFYRCCIEEDEAKGYLYGFFAAIFAWPLIGEVASIPVDKGAITRFSSFDIKTLGAYFFVVCGWVFLKILWRTGALKKSVCVFFLTFLSVWSFELYMENYSSMSNNEYTIVGGLLTIAVCSLLVVILTYAWNLFKVKKPIKAIIGLLFVFILLLTSLLSYRDVVASPDLITKMGKMSSLVLWISLLASYIILRTAKRSDSLATKTLLGCVFYIVFALLLMSGQWKEPQTFYVKYEAAGIPGEIEELKKEKEHLASLTDYMINKRMLKAGDYKYMYDHGLLSLQQVKKIALLGFVDGKGLEFLATRGLITFDEFQSVLTKNMISEKDLKPVMDLGIVKKTDKGYELQRQYLKMVKKED